MAIQIIKEPISKKTIEEIARNQFGDMVKVAVDIENNLMAIGGELHADEEKVLLENGSEQENIWGINLRLDTAHDAWIEFDSMINVRPSRGNRSRSVENQEIRQKIRDIVNGLIYTQNQS